MRIKKHEHRGRQSVAFECDAARVCELNLSNSYEDGGGAVARPIAGRTSRSRDELYKCTLASMDLVSLCTHVLG